MNTEELSLIVTALAVVVGPVTTYKLGVRRFAHEREMEDRADARSALAQGALELGRMKGVMKDTHSKFEKTLKGEEGWPSDTEGQIKTMEVALEALESALATVRIRFPHDDETVIRLEGAHDSARSALITYWMAAGTESDDYHADYAEAIKFGTIFDSYKDTYLIVAQKVVGAKLTEGRGSSFWD